MRLTIDVQKDPYSVQVGDLEIELTNVPEDKGWRVAMLQEELSEALILLEKARQEAQAKPLVGYLNQGMAEKILRDIIGGAYTPQNKINCIKLVREMTGMFLVDAKKLVDQIIPNGSNWPTTNEEIKTNEAQREA